jgi:predicted RNA-binding Zn ribbon-like protein
MSAPEPLFVGDDVALDFVNTAYGAPQDRHECLQSDQDVVAWLKRVGLLEAPETSLPPGKRGALLNVALTLRTSALHLIERRKAEGSADPSTLNSVLALGSSSDELVWKKGHPPKLTRNRTIASIEGLLVPVAESIAKLLTEADFELIRKCESADCTLWFHDRTKSHHRRWCSMAMCGNRAKVAAFRARQKGE